MSATHSIVPVSSDSRSPLLPQHDRDEVGLSASMSRAPDVRPPVSAPLPEMDWSLEAYQAQVEERAVRAEEFKEHFRPKKPQVRKPKARRRNAVAEIPIISTITGNILGHITDPNLLQYAVLLSDEAGVIKWNLPEEDPAGHHGNNFSNLSAILTADPGPSASDIDQPFMFIHWVVRTTETVDHTRQDSPRKISMDHVTVHISRVVGAAIVPAKIRTSRGIHVFPALLPESVSSFVGSDYRSDGCWFFRVLHISRVQFLCISADGYSKTEEEA
ncbi:MAG: hypothetical protein J3Q66DRAFT_367691 [Benniella sp.]|nr:MAG: hypothetical protein J3Q66DRAFT_367691 [Benniella sp.]